MRNLYQLAQSAGEGEVLQGRLALHELVALAGYE